MMKRQEIKQVLDELTKDIDSLADKKAVTIIKVLVNLVIQQVLLFIDDLERIIGRNRLTLRRWWLAGKFPKPVKLHGKTLAWLASTIYEWIDQNFK